MGATTQGSFKEETKSYERCDAGVYPARCIQVVELGTHDMEWQGEVKQRKEIMIVWELSELMQDGRPFTVTWRGTNTLNEKGKLYQMLTSWRGKPFTTDELRSFSLANILDKCCMINISKETSKAGKDFNKVISVMPLPKGMNCEPRYNELVDFGICDLGTEEFDKIWPWVQKIILDSHEGKRFNTKAADSYEQDIPLAVNSSEAF